VLDLKQLLVQVLRHRLDIRVVQVACNPPSGPSSNPSNGPSKPQSIRDKVANMRPKISPASATKTSIYHTLLLLLENSLTFVHTPVSAKELVSLYSNSSLLRVAVLSHRESSQCSTPTMLKNMFHCNSLCMLDASGIVSPSLPTIVEVGFGFIPSVDSINRWKVLLFRFSFSSFILFIFFAFIFAFYLLFDFRFFLFTIYFHFYFSIFSFSISSFSQTQLYPVGRVANPHHWQVPGGTELAVPT
jgi:hypothetical protein